MREKNYQTILSIILLIIVTLSTITATFAYFTARANLINLDKLQINSATMGQAYSLSGSPIDLLIEEEDMLKNKIDITKPTKTSSNETPISVIIETSASGGTLKCSYDIVYEVDTPFYNSTTNIDNVNEFVINGKELNYGLDILNEMSLGNISEEIVLLSDIEIKVTGINKQKVHDWVFNAGFYNQSFKQDEKSGISFGGNIVIKNLNCINTFLEM